MKISSLDTQTTTTTKMNKENVTPKQPQNSFSPSLHSPPPKNIQEIH